MQLENISFNIEIGAILMLLYWNDAEESLVFFESNFIVCMKFHYLVNIYLKLSTTKRTSKPCSLSLLQSPIVFKVSMYTPISVGFVFSATENA